MTATKLNSEITGNIENIITEIIFSNSLSDFGKGTQELIVYASKNGLSAETVLHELFQDIEGQYFADLYANHTRAYISSDYNIKFCGYQD